MSNASQEDGLHCLQTIYRLQTAVCGLWSMVCRLPSDDGLQTTDDRRWTAGDRRQTIYLQALGYNYRRQPADDGLQTAVYDDT